MLRAFLDDVPLPDGFDAPRSACDDPKRGAVMAEIVTVGLDLSKNVFQALGAGASGRVVLRQKLTQDQV